MRNTRNILKFIVTIVIITGVLFSIETFLKTKLKSIKTGTIGKINAVIDHQIDDEIMIWGASTALVNINPKVLSDSLNCTVMNMGLDGTNIDQYSGLLMEFLSYTKLCKKLILAFDINDGLVERNQFYQTSLWVHQLDNPRIAKTFNEINPELLRNPFPFSNLTLYDMHIIKELKRTFFEKESQFSFPNKGFESVSIEEKPVEIKNKKTIEISERIVKKINAVCELAISKNIEPIIVITPCHINGQSRLLNKNEIISIFNKLSSNSILVLDLHNTSISMDEENFYDNVHLNSIGSMKFTKLLLQKINTTNQ